MEIMGDWTSTTYITSQALMAVGLIFFIATYFAINRSKLLGLNITSNTIVAVGFALLGGWSAMAMCGIAAARDITSGIINKNRPAKDANKTTRLDYALLVFWMALFTIAMFFTFQGPISLFPYFETLLFTYSIWQKNIFVYRLLGIVCASLWIVYNIWITNFVGLMTESIVLLAALAGLILYISRNQLLKRK